MKSKVSCMRCVFCGLVLCISMLFPPFASHSAQASDAYSKATKLYLDGKYTEALDTAKGALTEAEKNHSSSSIELVKPLSLLADIQNSRGDYQQAAQYLERLKTIQESILGKNHRDVADTVSRLIKVYEKQGDTEKAIRLNDLAASRWGGGSATRYVGSKGSDNIEGGGRTVELTHERDVECANYIRMYRECLTVSCTDQRMAFLNKESRACMDQAVAHRDKKKRQIESMESKGTYVPYNFEELLMVKEYRRFQATLQNQTDKQLNAIGRSVDAINELASGNWVR